MERTEQLLEIERRLIYKSSDLRLVLTLFCLIFMR